MSHSCDNVRPLIFPQVRRHRYHTHVADVIPLRRARRAMGPWHAIAIYLVAVTMATVAALALASALRVGNAVLVQIVPTMWW
jgi:hypothetical protein